MGNLLVFIQTFKIVSNYQFRIVTSSRQYCIQLVVLSVKIFKFIACIAYSEYFSINYSYLLL